MTQPDAKESIAASALNTLRTLRILRSASAALFAQASLHARLAQVEWISEKARLSRLLAMAALAFASVLCAMLFAGGLILAIGWDSEHRLFYIGGVIVLYTAIAAYAWHRIGALSAQGANAFRATREELAADMDMLRSRL